MITGVTVGCALSVVTGVTVGCALSVVAGVTVGCALSVVTEDECGRKTGSIQNMCRVTSLHTT